MRGEVPERLCKQILFGDMKQHIADVDQVEPLAQVEFGIGNVGSPECDLPFCLLN